MDFLDVLAFIVELICRTAIVFIVSYLLFYENAGEELVLLSVLIFLAGLILYPLPKNRKYDEFEKIQREKEKAWRKEHPLSARNSVQNSSERKPF